ncbi:zeta toxin family protein [Legionella cincinnatiensis]|uniref:Zeta toxin n=1 Tax=Legionella cincinnatiensis TaxID=28085 RepID=A0A378IHT9_9GAMM|nr:zeta toxin family protein [Legionella cincinnatiensis]KTC83541.1 Zeta toxin [Legionella cincinnatiensis]STX34500.1 Zeta toxin [Legionella cincinnatiensis]
MTKVYSKKCVNFDLVNKNELPRYEYHRTLRDAIELSATSYSKQSKNSIMYQWDNIAPEIALVVLQDAKKIGIDIQEEVLQVIGTETFHQECLKAALEKLQNNPHYSLFLQKLALHITHRKSQELSVEHLKSLGINTIDQFNKIFIHFLSMQSKLAKSFPNFHKIREEDDYEQFIAFMTNEPLYESFLLSFTQYLASEFNQRRTQSEQVETPKEIDSKALLKFLHVISYDLCLTMPNKDLLKKNTLYIELFDNQLKYTVIDPSGKEINAIINFCELDFALDKTVSEEDLKKHLPAILRITSQRGHTGDISLYNTSSLKDKGIAFLDSDLGASLFLAHLPAVDLVKDEEMKFSLYQWLSQGNLARFKDLLAAGACQHYNQELDIQIKQIKETVGINEVLQNEIETIGLLMKEIVTLVAALEEDPHAKDKELDNKIIQLIKLLKTIDEFYKNTPLLKQNETFPSTTGNFENFIKKIIFNSTNDKITQYVPDSKEKEKIWKLNLVDLVIGLVNNTNFVSVRDVKNKKEHSFLTDESSLVIPPSIVFREQLKDKLTSYLKNDIHHYHTVRSYENDKLNLTQAPVVFKGEHLTDSLAETEFFAKKVTRIGEYPTDSHLLSGQENNLKKHEIRSGTATPLAATGVGTHTVTDKFDITLKFGGMNDIKILYIVRGKEAFHSQPFAEMMGKTKLSEIAYTHLKPQDYVMTIIYDHNHEILDVIPGNLNGEIQGVSDQAKEILAAGIDFYNKQHDHSLLSKPSVRLPHFQAQKQKATNPLPKKKPLLALLHMHQMESNSLVKKMPSTNSLGSVRISRSARNGNKILSMDILRPEVKEVRPLSEELTLPEQSFSKPLNRLSEVREAAVAHFNMRHILTLKGLSRWNTQEKKLHETYNRILQPNFMEGDLQDQLIHANIAHEEWLTDVLVPKMQTTLMLHLATRLITDYRVDVEEVNKLAQQLFHSILKSSTKFEKLLDAWSKIYISLKEPNTEQICTKKAHERMEKLYPSLNQGSIAYQSRFNSCFIMEMNKIQKKLVNQTMSAFLDKNLDDFTEEIKLEKKTVYSLTDNHDFVFLGPAASGKSTISNRYIKKEERKDYVSLATDDYRGIFMPFTDEFEKQETEQVFIRTQDSAYLISELIEEHLQAKKEKRPNIIIDGVTYKPSQKALVAKNNNSLVICACLNDMSEVVKRSYERARQEESSSADKGRYVNTTSLIHMHKTASLNLLIHCDPNTTIAFYNTNVPRNTIPPLIATVDTHGEKTLTISHDKGSLMCLASFFNKARVNTGAKSDKHLFLKRLKQPEFQIDSLFAVTDYGFKIVLNGEHNKPCFTVKKESNGQMIMEIIDPEQIKMKIKENKTEKSLLQMFLLYAKLGNLKSVQKECLLHDDIDFVVDQLIDTYSTQDNNGNSLLKTISN